MLANVGGDVIIACGYVLAAVISGVGAWLGYLKLRGNGHGDVPTMLKYIMDDIRDLKDKDERLQEHLALQDQQIGQLQGQIEVMETFYAGRPPHLRED